MKLFIVLFAIAATAIAAPLTPASLVAGHVRDDIAIVSKAYNLLADGVYNHKYETANGIIASENGIGGQFAKGSVEYSSPEGEHVVLQYTADENGYQPSGSHIHPIPDYITRSLEYIRTHPSKN